MDWTYLSELEWAARVILAVPLVIVIGGLCRG